MWARASGYLIGATLAATASGAYALAGRDNGPRITRVVARYL